jgi:hypothetical protein
MSIATDHALATIASILGPPGRAREKITSAQPETPVADAKPAAGADKPAAGADEPAAEASEPVTAAATPAPKAVIEPVGYSKSGPGPMAALRFKWAVRHGDDGYYVDETVGAASVPVVNGPMDGEAAIQFVDDRAREAQECFQALKNEMNRPWARSAGPGLGQRGGMAALPFDQSGGDDEQTPATVAGPGNPS